MKESLHNIQLINEAIYLNRKYIEEFGIKGNTIDSWLKRKNSVNRIFFGKDQYFEYSSLPVQTKSKLPAVNELIALNNQRAKESQVNSFYDKLKYAQENKFFDYRNYYRDQYGLNAQDALKAAMKRAVWGCFMELYESEHSDGYNGGLKKGSLQNLYDAYNRIYPRQYSSKHAILPTIKRCKGDGFDSIIIDKRKFENVKNRKFGPLHVVFVDGVISIGKAFTAPQILQKISPMCKAKNIQIPSLSWIKNYMRNNQKNNIQATRYGNDKTVKTMPYASMQTALYAGNQWQVDGWTLPFYFRNETGGLDKLTLIAVIDSYSKKIVGYEISRSENRLSIMSAFEDSIANTGYVPFEILADNHTFNKTKEGLNFIEQLQNIGTTWTVSENPQYKALIERGFKSIGEQFCKHQHGYIGQGIKSKDKNAHSSPELIQKFIKAGKILTENEIKLIGITVVQEYNNANRTDVKKSPNQLFEESEHPKVFKLDHFERLKLTTLKSEYKVTRGQINIVIAGVKYEFQLNAATYKIYNNKHVAVRYDTPELIYLFDLKTDNPICSLKQKSKIHGALADQTENDLKLLAQNAGRTKGIKVQSQKESEDLVSSVLKQHPDALEILHHYTTPKDVVRFAQIDVETRREAIKRGINPEMIQAVPRVTEITNPIFLAKKTTRKQTSPFTPDNHQIGVLEPTFQDNE